MSRSTVALYFLLLCPNKADCQSCRAVNTEVKYTYPTAEIETAFPDDAHIIRLQGKSITIRLPEFHDKVYLGTSHLLTSEDLGKHWVIDPSHVPSIDGPGPYIQAPSDQKILYKRIYDWGPFLRSEDGGKSWTLPQYEINGKSPEQAAYEKSQSRKYQAVVNLLTVHPKEPRTLFASISVIPWSVIVSGGSDLPVYHLPGIYVSKDGGDHWAPFSKELHSDSPLGIDPKDVRKIYARSQTSVLFSTDGGDSWGQIGDADQLVRPPVGLSYNPLDSREMTISHFLFAPNSPDILYMLTNKGIYKTANAGNNWCLLNIGFDIIQGINSLATLKDNPSTLFAGTLRGLFYSHDGGSNWSKIAYPK
jgi:photosystem II stability/assembly factor-like uncharacterized protein